MVIQAAASSALTSDSDERFIMALDSGTTSVRASILNKQGEVLAQAGRPLPNYFPQDGWVEQDPFEILANQISAMAEVQIKCGISADKIAAIGITNQRETTIVWDRLTGQPVYNAIVWQDRRTADAAQRLADEGYLEMIQGKTGLLPDAYFSATKIAWILRNVEGARVLADEGRLMFGTVDTWLIYNLTGKQVHATDYTNASRTMLFNIHDLTWDQQLLDLFDIPASMLPDVRWSSDDYGIAQSEYLAAPVPICGVAGDQQASLFGHCCFESGQAKNTYGTGCFMLMNTGDKVFKSKNGLLSTIGIALDGTISYALEGSIFQAGTVIEWLQHGLGLISSPQETAAIAQSVESNEGCYLVPAFTGLGAPWWNADARGLFCGITRATGRAHLVRAACESMAYQTYDVLQAMQADSGLTLSSLSVDGGGSKNDFIMQYQADMLQINVERLAISEATSQGAAYLAGLYVGFWKSTDEIAANRKSSKTFVPCMSHDEVALELCGWHEAVARACD